MNLGTDSRANCSLHMVQDGSAEADFFVADAFPSASPGRKFRRTKLDHLAEDAEYLEVHFTRPG